KDPSVAEVFLLVAPPRQRPLAFSRQKGLKQASAFLLSYAELAFALQKSPVRACEDRHQNKNPSLRLGYLSWWLLPDSNWGHKALQASALPTELKSHIMWRHGNKL